MVLWRKKSWRKKLCSLCQTQLLSSESSICSMCATASKPESKSKPKPECSHSWKYNITEKIRIDSTCCALCDEKVAALYQYRHFSDPHCEKCGRDGEDIICKETLFAHPRLMLQKETEITCAEVVAMRPEGELNLAVDKVYCIECWNDEKRIPGEWKDKMTTKYIKGWTSLGDKIASRTF